MRFLDCLELKIYSAVRIQLVISLYIILHVFCSLLANVAIYISASVNVPDILWVVELKSGYSGVYACPTIGAGAIVWGRLTSFGEMGHTSISPSRAM